MNLKRIILMIVVIAIITGLIMVVLFSKGKNDIKSNGKLNVVVTGFSTYDFIKQIAGDNVNLSLLLKPGIDSHSYEPTAQDLITIQNADIFIYVGGNMEKWIDKILSGLDLSKTKTLKLTDIVQMQEEQEVDGAEEHHDYEEEDTHEEIEVEYDEHIWTSPANSIIIVQKLADLLSAQDDENKDIYQENSREYIGQIKDVQAKIREIVDNKVRDRLVFGDKMPMQYFLNEFGLTASAAFNGCSTETEPSVSTIAYLTNKVKEEKIPVVLYIELNSGKVANTIAEEAHIQAMQIQSVHNVSKNDFDNGETYVSLMTRNLEVFKKALQ